MVHCQYCCQYFPELFLATLQDFKTTAVTFVCVHMYKSNNILYRMAGSSQAGFACLGSSLKPAVTVCDQ